jgi:flagellar biosynthesis protein FlhF
MREIHGEGRRAPETLAQELALARTALTKLWREAPLPEANGTAPLHVFLGPPGSGKSTALCKWLAQNTLVDGLPARVWRLDSRTTNVSERVSLYAEILGVPAERSWNGRGAPGEVGFVDLAGADFQDPEGIDALGETLARLPGASVHLVLNAAYTVPLLLAQARAFSRLPVDDLVLTHLDEETAWGKLWNLVLGTNYPLNRLSAGQNIPGRFLVARPEVLVGSLFGA